MARLLVDGDTVVVQLGSWEKLGALHGDVRVPVSAIRSIHRVDEAAREVLGLRAPGTGLPRVVGLGTWRRRGAKDFVAVYRRRPGVVVELDGAEFERLVVTADLPDELTHLVRDDD